MRPANSLSVACLCAEWCHACRDYRPGFFALPERFPHAEFRWIDIEEHPAGDLEVESFPTVRVTRGEEILFHGLLPPKHEHLRRLLETLLRAA